MTKDLDANAILVNHGPAALIDHLQQEFRRHQQGADNRNGSQGPSDASKDNYRPSAIDAPNTPRLQPIDIEEFCKLEIKKREMVLDPILPEKGLAMVYSQRGVGKTHFGLGIGYAVATGSKFLKWSAPKARRVLLVDGEMPAAALQERMNAVLKAAEITPVQGMFRVLAADLVEEAGIGNLANPNIQKELDALLIEENTDFLILDNLSSLTAVLRDNDEASWQPMKAWLLCLRRRGITVLVLHHAGKGGDQRGTSAREDVLDTSISLRHPSDYRPEEGARFEIHIEKGRGIFGDDAKPFEAKLMMIATSDGAELQWTTKEIDDVNRARVAALLEDGLTVRDIENETGISKSAVQRLKAKIEGAKNANLQPEVG